MAKLKIITGGKGSGKSALCIEQIKKVHEQFPEARCIMLVNEHYSYEMEKSFIDAFGGTGLNNIEVKTFRRLAADMLSEKKIKYMTAAGKLTLISRAVKNFLSRCVPENRETDENKICINEKLYSSIGKRGFLDILGQMFSEFKNYELTPQEVAAMAENTADEALAQKLMAAADIYAVYTDMFESTGYTDADDTYDALADLIEESNELDGVYLWIDKFDEILPQQMRVVRALFNKACELTVSINYPQNTDEKLIYSEVKRTLDKVSALSGDAEYTDCGRHLKNVKSEDLFFFLDKFNSYQRYDKNSENIRLFESSDAYHEIKRTADEIVRLVFDEGMRYRDICVVCGDENEYMHLMETIFDEYDIPYFADEGITLNNHPAAEQILSLFDMFENRFSYESVFSYLRAGYIYLNKGKKLVNMQEYSVDGADLDELENYVIKYGINGEKKWLDTVWEKEKSFVDSAFEAEEEDTDVKGIEELHRIAAEPVKRYRRKTRGKKNAQIHASALFGLLKDIKMYEGINSDITSLCKNPDDEKNITEARILEKLWNLIIEMLEQLVAALGDSELTRYEFGEYVKIALSECEIRMIPSGIDRVYIGPIESVSAAPVKAMFMLGANEGCYSSQIKTEGFLSDEDRNYINSTFTKGIAPDTHSNMDRRRFSVWSAMAEVSERLYISCCRLDSSGHEQPPARLFTSAAHFFPKLKILSDSDFGMNISTLKVTLHEMLINKSAANEGNDPLWDVVYECLKNEKYKLGSISELWKKAKSYTKITEKITPSLAKLLYGENPVYSASRLNTYAMCPLRYFMNYGLRAKQREEYKIAANEIGTYAHGIIEQFCAVVEGDAKTPEEKLEKWRTLPDNPGEGKSRDEIIDELIDKTIENIGADNIYMLQHIKSIFHRTGKVIKKAAKTVHSSLKYGKYTIASEECELKYNINDEVSVQGRIDRIDELNKESGKKIRIIDYKTGNTKFDIVHIYNGIDMQLVIYALMAKGYYEEKQPCGISGMYYNFVKETNEVKKPEQSRSEIEEKIKKGERLNGITFVESTEDLKELADIDENYEEKSDVINIRYTPSKKISPKQNPLIRSSEDAQALMAFVEDKICAMDSEIREDGNIKPDPISDTSINSCAYCDFAQICGLDGEIKVKKISGDAKEIWKKIKGEEE